ncbi:hypothetical protein RRG08_026742 [Elysia crispata]|uniref:Uncharacterized protein n=1 Tax=Elysia crispata TaxID=231223 RepID=A0AAE1AQ98_9GAST|nr:hypothetical protein RRG08_026742 [Elysia crispata]
MVYAFSRHYFRRCSVGQEADAADLDFPVTAVRKLKCLRNRVNVARPRAIPSSACGLGLPHSLHLRRHRAKTSGRGRPHKGQQVSFAHVCFEVRKRKFVPFWICG